MSYNSGSNRARNFDYNNNFISVSSVFSNVVLIGDTVDELLNIKNPNWWEADQLAIFTTRSWS